MTAGTVALPDPPLPPVQIDSIAFRFRCGDSTVTVHEARDGTCWWAGATRHDTRIDAITAAHDDVQRIERRRRLGAELLAALDEAQ